MRSPPPPMRAGRRHLGRQRHHPGHLQPDLPRSVVVVDFTGKNANVMYETSIAPRSASTSFRFRSSLDDVPFDLRQRRVAKYQPNGEGLASLRMTLKEKLKQLRGARAGRRHPVLNGASRFSQQRRDIALGAPPRVRSGSGSRSPGTVWHRSHRSRPKKKSLCRPCVVPRLHRPRMALRRRLLPRRGVPRRARLRLGEPRGFVPSHDGDRRRRR